MKKTKPDRSAIFAQLFPNGLTKGDHTKILMIEAAIDCIAKVGLEGLTFEAVGERMGMNRAQVRYHFREKGELLDRAIDYAIASAQTVVLEKLKTSRTWKTQISAVADGFFDWIDRHPTHGSVLLALYYSASVVPARRKFHSRAVEMGFNRVYSILKEAKLKKSYRDEELRLTSMMIWATIDGFMIYTLATNLEEKPGDFRKRALKAIEVILAGL